MGRKQKRYYFIYKTTNLVNNKYYIGMHSTNNLDDGYLGSGKYLWNSINYHGKENHICEILEYCKDRKELVKRESEIVNEQLINEELCMNIKTGGQGGFSSKEHMIKCSKAGNKAKSLKLKTNKGYYNKYIDKLSKLTKQSIKDGVRTTWKDNYDWTGKKHSDETKQKMRKLKNIGSSNSQYGTMWITNETENRKISKNSEVPEGWRRGRIIKKRV